ncbi:MAG: CHAD domain-containing protein [Methylocystis sp.]|uniref:CHAD domain-containing protein n=1 Tax=Methylocystis sp. TaxID=1911079 RepID=UPI0039208698
MQPLSEPEVSPARDEAREESQDAPAPTSIKAKPIELSHDDALEGAAAAIFSGALEHFLANVPLLQSLSAPESVHQMRVALRRLRAAIGLLRPAVAGPALETAANRAKALAATLGAARDWDVFGLALSGGPREAIGDDPSFHALTDALEALREKAYRAAHEAVSSDETARFVDDLRLAIARRDWEAAPESHAPGSARAFAADALTGLRKRLLKKSKGLATLSADERHRVRIALKKARYGAEFFESLFDGRKDARAYLHALGEMQDQLGLFNDMEVANGLLDQIDSLTPEAARASSFIRGWFAHAARQGVAHAETSEKRLKKLAPFWT